MGFLSRLLVPRGVRRAVHPVRTVKRAATPKVVKKASGHCIQSTTSATAPNDRRSPHCDPAASGVRAELRCTSTAVAPSPTAALKQQRNATTANPGHSGRWR
jgi:hypothetical protein